jgi:hypothetical protein
MSRWCLYLPGICMHAVPASCRQGSGDLHLEVDHFPAALKFHSVPTREAVIQERAEVVDTASSPPPIPARHPGRMASTASTVASSSDEFSEEEEERFAWLTIIEKAFENTSTSVAASQMRNALTALADTVKDPQQKEVSLLLGDSRMLGN